MILFGNDPQIVDSTPGSHGDITWIVNTSYPISQTAMTSAQIKKHTPTRHSFHVTVNDESVLQIAKCYAIAPREVRHV